MRLFLIDNPQAGKNRKGRLTPTVVEALLEAGCTPEVTTSAHKGHITDLVARLDFSGYDGIVVMGGDGTLFEAVNGYMANRSPRRIPLGVIPLGTGNSFSLDLGLRPRNWQQAVQVIAHGQVQWADVACFEENGRCRYFINILGLGFVADVTQRADGLKWMGNLAYTVATLHRMMHHAPMPVTLTLDGQHLERETVFVTVSNSRYTSNFFIAPQARIDDGLLDVLVLHHMSRRALLRHFPKVLDGSHLALAEVEVFRAADIRIHTPHPVALAPDGECTGHTPLHIRCLPRTIPFFAQAEITNP